MGWFISNRLHHSITHTHCIFFRVLHQNIILKAKWNAQLMSSTLTSTMYQLLRTLWDISFLISGCEKAFARPDKLKEHIHQHKKLNVDTVTKITRNATSSTGSVMLLTKQKGDSAQIDEMLCKHCQSCRFESQVELMTHEQLCSQIPKLVSTSNSNRMLILLHKLLGNCIQL